jgi:hypothetical protein
MFRHIKMANTKEYYDLNAGYKLNGYPTDATTTMSQEGFSAMFESYKNSTHEPMTSTIVSMDDSVPKLKYKSTKVKDPYGYGYNPTLKETRVQNSIDIVNQERMMFSIGAVTGVSLIVLGIMLTSNNN